MSRDPNHPLPVALYQRGLLSAETLEDMSSTIRITIIEDGHI